jgi:hypothetical protein
MRTIKFIFVLLNSIHTIHKHDTALLLAGFILLLQVFMVKPSWAQGAWYWNQSLNAEASLLSGAVVAGESGIAAIYYNPATIPLMTTSNLSLSANLFSITFFNVENAIGTGSSTDNTQIDVQPRIITLTLNPKKRPDLTIEMAYFAKDKYYFKINQGSSLTGDIVPSNPGPENYTADYYYRSSYQDTYGGIGVGYNISNSLSLGYSGMISYKDDQYYNLITVSAFTPPEIDSGFSRQYLSNSMYQLNYSMYDTRLITKLGLHWRQNSWSVGVNINLPSVKLFGDGTVVKQYGYSNIHKDPAISEGINAYYGGRQQKCISHFKDPMSVAAGVNYYTPSGKTVFLFTAEYFFGLSDYEFIEASEQPVDNGYDYLYGASKEWLSFAVRQKPVLNAGMAFRYSIKDNLMFSGGFRTDFNFKEPVEKVEFLEYNSRNPYTFHIYHVNYGLNYKFDRGSLILGMQYSYGRANDQKQIINLTEPVEYISESQMPLTGPIKNNVQIRYNDIAIYIGFMFNFLKELPK